METHPRGAAPSGVRDLLRLAGPSIASFVCQSGYRVNDQYWVGRLGPKAHAALGPSTFFMVFNFSIFFLAVSGSMSLVARASGANDPRGRDRVMTHALVMGSVIALALGLVGSLVSGPALHGLGLTGETAALGREYLRTIYWVSLPLALAPLVETFFIATGDTLVPLGLQLLAIATNLLLNPCLILGLGPFPALGMSGAALATGVSRALSASLGLWLLHRRGVRFQAHGPLRLGEMTRLLRIGLPSSVAITIYSSIYFALIGLVLAPLGDPVLGGFAIGFNAFEGVSFPVYLGLGMAGSSLVGRNLGAGRPDLAQEAVRSLRICASVAGTLFTLLFLYGAGVITPWFTRDPATRLETLRYVHILAASQLFVALETVHEKVHLGAGHTAPIFWISVPGNILRLPLGWLFAVPLGLGATGIWWAINVSSFLKSLAYGVLMRRGGWRRVRL